MGERGKVERDGKEDELSKFGDWHQSTLSFLFYMGKNWNVSKKHWTISQLLVSLWNYLSVCMFALHFKMSTNILVNDLGEGHWCKLLKPKQTLYSNPPLYPPIWCKKRRLCGLKEDDNITRLRPQSPCWTVKYICHHRKLQYIDLTHNVSQ